MHRLIELQAQRRVLVVEEEKDFASILLSEADFDIVGHLEQRLEVAKLAQPGDQIVIKMRVAERADIDGLAESESVHRDGWMPSIEVLGIGGQDLALLRLDEVAPQTGGVQMTRRKCPFEREMIFLARRQLVEFH